MTALLHFTLSALLVSAAARLSLALAADAPPRFKFWVAMLGLAAWIVPWPLISLPLVLSTPASVVGWVDQGVRIVGTHPALSVPLSTLEVPTSIPAMGWLMLLVPGLVWFAFEYCDHRRIVNGWWHNSRDGRGLAQLLPSRFGSRGLRIRVVSDSAIAAASGVLRPTLWLGERLGDEELRTALVHEYCHARSHDPLWLLLIRLVKRAYCWNPLVRGLARQAQLWLEAACDRKSAQMLGRQCYSLALARLILANHPQAQGVAALIGAHNENVRRLELLQRAVRTGWREYACIALCTATALGGISFAAPVHDPRIGNWAEVGESAPADDPILRSFEDLGGGLTRLKDDVLHDGTAGLWSDHRCDGRNYALRDRSGDTTEWMQSCRLLDARTVEVAVSEMGATRPAWRTVDRVSEDGETYTSVVTPSTSDGSDGRSVTHVFWRLH